MKLQRTITALVALGVFTFLGIGLVTAGSSDAHAGSPSKRERTIACAAELLVMKTRHPHAGELAQGLLSQMSVCKAVHITRAAMARAPEQQK